MTISQCGESQFLTTLLAETVEKLAGYARYLEVGLSTIENTRLPTDVELSYLHEKVDYMISMLDAHSQLLQKWITDVREGVAGK